MVVVGSGTGGASSSHTTPSLVCSSLEYTARLLPASSAKKKSDDPQSGYLSSCRVPCVWQALSQTELQGRCKEKSELEVKFETRGKIRQFAEEREEERG